jgi:hypothetical protein
VHLVNLTNPATMKGPYKSFVPVGAQKISIKLPSGTTPKAVKLLVSGVLPSTDVSGSQLSLTVPSILDHEVIAVDL